MSGIVDPSTPEREAVMMRMRQLPHDGGCKVYAPSQWASVPECSCRASERTEELVDALEAKAYARALADVAGWVEGMEREHADECTVERAPEFRCSCGADTHNAALDALLAKLREAK